MMTATPPVQLKDFKTGEKTCRAALRVVQSLGFENIILCGGALRDCYLGLEDKINDYDLVADFGPRVDVLVNAGDYRQAMLDFVNEKLGGIRILSRASFDGLHDSKPDPLGMTLKFIHAGKEFSLSLAHDCGRQEDWVNGDAPINSITLSSQGRALAHPLFETHAQSRIYAPFADVPPERAAERFIYLQKKIGGLRLI